MVNMNYVHMEFFLQTLKDKNMATKYWLYWCSLFFDGVNLVEIFSCDSKRFSLYPEKNPKHLIVILGHEKRFTKTFYVLDSYILLRCFPKVVNLIVR